MRALELLDIKPAVYISIEKDPACNEVVERAWPEVISLDNLETLDLLALGDRLKEGSITKGLIIGGAPCQGFTRLSASRQGFEDPRSGGVAKFAELVIQLKRLAPHIEWHAMLENVASMSESDRTTITHVLDTAYPTIKHYAKGTGVKPYWIDAAILGQVSRPRLYWPSWKVGNTGPQEELKYQDSDRGYVYVTNPSTGRIPVR
jgi:site-specific DNA-cytosine methylase